MRNALCTSNEGVRSFSVILQHHCSSWYIYSLQIHLSIHKEENGNNLIIAWSTYHKEMLSLVQVWQ